MAKLIPDSSASRRGIKNGVSRRISRRWFKFVESMDPYYGSNRSREPRKGFRIPLPPTGFPPSRRSRDGKRFMALGSPEGTLAGHPRAMKRFGPPEVRRGPAGSKRCCRKGLGSRVALHASIFLLFRKNRVLWPKSSILPNSLVIFRVPTDSFKMRRISLLHQTLSR